MSPPDVLIEAGRRYELFGLEDRAVEIAAAARQLGELIGSRVDAADAALAGWHGPHAGAFVERVNGVLWKMVSLRLALEHAASRCSAFPDAPYPGSIVYVDASFAGATVAAVNPATGAAGAATAALDGYISAAIDQDFRFAGLAATVTTEGLTAEVTTQRSLTAAERQQRLDDGWPRHEVETATVPHTEPVAIGEVFGLPDLSGLAETLATTSRELSSWVRAVALAFDAADQGLLQLLLDYPQLAGYIDAGLMTDGRMGGDAALAIVLAYLSTFDTAGDPGSDADRNVGVSDLEAIANDPSADPHLRAAAQYLLDNRLLTSMASIASDPTSYEVQPEEVSLSADDITLFLAYNEAVRAVATNFEALDIADDDDHIPDDYVSPGDLEAAASDESLPDELRDAARFLLDHGMLTQRLSLYERANPDRMTLNSYGETRLTDDVSGFTRDGVIALAVDQQAFASDPAAARQFVLGLPMADEHGDGGLSVMLTSDEGVRALANSALLDARGDLSDQHAVIAHLPETTGWGGNRGAVENHGGVRNQLINGFYELIAHETDGLFAGDLAGDPTAPGHPGANWLMYAPWASSGVRGAITGDTTVLGVTTSDVWQGAADGNQWIFNDIGARFTSFIELYERNPVPTDAELRQFFDSTFDEGDGTIRTGFAAYVAAMDEDDPVRRSQLLFQGNVLVATHEQAGAQPYLDQVAVGPDGFATRYIDVQVGDYLIEVDHDIPAIAGPDNHIVGADILDFDTGGLQPSDFVDLDLDPISGIESFRPDFSPSAQDWFQGSDGEGAPDDLAGSGASSWPDWEDRMWSITRLFEQTHTDRSLFRTDDLDASLDQVTWLDEAARPGG